MSRLFVSYDDMFYDGLSTNDIKDAKRWILNNLKGDADISAVGVNKRGRLTYGVLFNKEIDCVTFLLKWTK